MRLSLALITLTVVLAAVHARSADFDDANEENKRSLTTAGGDTYIPPPPTTEVDKPEEHNGKSKRIMSQSSNDGRTRREAANKPKTEHCVDKTGSSVPVTEDPSSTRLNYKADFDGNGALSSTSVSFEIACLRAHNYYRRRHLDTPDLLWDSKLACEAQQYCDDHLLGSSMEHSNCVEGENLYRNVNVQKIINPAAAMATKAWYDEIEFYNFDKPAFAAETGHLTQLVWKKTTHLGCGYCFIKGPEMDITELNVICRYSPAGNTGDYGTNVGQLKAAYTVEELLALTEEDISPRHPECIESEDAWCMSSFCGNPDIAKFCCACKEK